jgi:hypothetical protein
MLVSVKYSQNFSSLRRRGCPTDPDPEAVSEAGAHEKAKLKEDRARLSKLTHVVYLRGKLFFQMALPAV